MQKYEQVKRLLLTVLAILALTVAACSDDSGGGTTDTEPADTGGGDGEADMIPDTGGDMLPDTGGGDMLPDTAEDAAAEADVPAPVDLCVANAAALTADDGLLASQVGDIVSACIFGPCITCALGGVNCGAGGTIESCMTGCITTNEFDDCSVDACDAGFTCTDDVCRLDAGDAVLAAVGGGDLSVDCIGCFVGITACGADACPIECQTDECQCEACRCDEGCEAAFAECSGIPPLALDCTSVPEDATMCLDEQDPPQPTGDCDDSTLEACGGTPGE